MKTKSITKKEIVIKIVMSAVLLALLFLSFLFSETFENALGLNRTLAKNEVEQADMNDSAYKVHYIDVGQGNSSLIELPDGKVVLIDAGNTMYGETVEAFLLKQGVAKIDYLIATHADSDHIGGFSHILKKFEVINIFRPFQIAGTGTNAESFEVYEYEDLGEVYDYYQDLTNNKSKISRVTSSVYKEFIKSIYTETYTIGNNVYESKITVFYDGLKITGEGYEIEFFAPLLRDDNVNLLEMSSETYGFATKGYGVTESNDNSAVFLFSCFGDKFLYTGDAAWKDSSSDEYKFGKFEELDFVNSLTESEKELFNGITVYIAGHHGSSHSSSELLLSLINPEFVVISVGSNNNYGHPSSEVIFRIKRTKNLETDYLLRTDLNGSITFGKCDGKTVYVLEVSSKSKDMTISWELFASVVCGILISFIIFTKPWRSRKVKFIDRLEK